MEFKLPELGEGVYEAELVSWHVQPGDVVEAGQNLLEVLTDKATMEVPAPFAGTIGTLHVEPGATLKVGDVVLEYQPAGSSQPPPTPAKRKPSAAPVGASVSKSKPKRSVEEVAIPVPAKTDMIGVHVNGNPQPPAAVPASVRAAPSVRYMAQAGHRFGPTARQRPRRSHFARRSGQANPKVAGQRRSKRRTS